MDFGSRRQKAPLWPASRQGNYQNLSSGEDLALQDTPTPGTGMSAQYDSLLTPSYNASHMPQTPGLQESVENTPKVDEFVYDEPAPRKRFFGVGWRGGARVAFFSMVVVLSVNITLLVYMSTAFMKMDGFPVIFRGTCEEAETQNKIWHIVINVLSTIMLAGGNYCMQLLCAPTRKNIDKAHAKGVWLDIGIPSIRNLRFLSWKRRAFWLAICISSIPLHLVYNSTFYAAIATNDYNILYAVPDFANGATYDTTKFPDSHAMNISHIQSVAPTWKELNNHDCIVAYAHDFITKYRNVIAVVANTSQQYPDNSLVGVAINELPDPNNFDATFDSFAWICNDTETSDKTNVHTRNSAGFVPCANMVRNLENMANTWWKSSGYHISHCLVEEIKADCHLHFSPHLMGPVVLMNIVKCLVAFYVAFRLRDNPLVTLGDAIESFIKNPDPTTKGMCLATAHQMDHQFSRATHHTPEMAPMTFDGTRHRWRKIITKRQWILLFGLFAIMFAGLLAGIVLGTATLAPPTLANAWSVGLGIVQTQNIVYGANLPQLGAAGVLVTALVANAPQALLSFLYMIYNTIFTLMHVGEDWDMYGAYTATTRHKLKLAAKKQTHRFLRVSIPKGTQKATHFLNLPFRYAIPLGVTSALLHWLTSQSLFLANVSVIPRDGTSPKHDEITTVAYAPQGMIWLVALAFCMLSVVLMNSFRRFGGQMPIVGSNSAAIAAACHVDLPTRRRYEMVLHKLAWGEIPSSKGSKPLDDYGMKGPSSSRNSKQVSGLGIDSVDDDSKKNAVYSVQDFSDVIVRQGLEDGDFGDEEYQVLRGNPEMVDVDGPIARSTGVAHCTFSDHFVYKPETGKLYA